MSTQNQEEDEAFENEAEATDNLSLLAHCLEPQSLARKLVEATESDSSLAGVIELRLEELRSTYAVPAPHDD